MISLRFRILAVSTLVGLLLTDSVAEAEPASPATRFRFEAVSDASLGLWEEDKPVLVYNHGMVSRPQVRGSRARSCYFHPVYGLSGEVLTDDFPLDHTYHRGMYWAWPHIEIGEREYELWSLRGELRQQFVRWLSKETTANGAKLGVENGWFVGERQVVREQVWAHIHPQTKDSRSIDLELTWTSLNEPLTLRGAEGKSYGGFNFRFGPRTKTVITVPENAELPEGVSAQAGRVSGDLLVTKLPWVGFAGNFEGATGLSGAAIFVHPGHRDYPPTWMARHYGLVSVGWPGTQAQSFPAGMAVTCRYRVWIHGGAVSAAEIQNQYDLYQSASR